jgi:oligoendopeptidase F
MSQELNNKLCTTKVIWRLTDLYSSQSDPQLQKDILHCQTVATHINTEYSGRVASLTPEEIYALVEKLEEIAAKKGRISTFAFLQFSTNTKDPEAGAFLQKVREIGSKINKETIFFELEWNQLSNKQAQSLLSETVLAKYKHYLAGMRRYAPHLLSRTEEGLLIEIAPVGRSSWTNLFDKVMGHLKFGKQKRTEEEVLSDLYSPDRDIRKNAAKDLTAGLKSQLHILTHISNTLLADKMIDDGIRKYASWVSSMNLYNELPDSTVNTLVQTVTSRYDLPQRYYRLKKSLLNYEELHDYDRYAPLPNLPDRHIPWPECKKIVLQAFHEFSPEIGEIADLFFTKNWIHAPIMEGKRGGAFAHPCTPDVHPYILVNYTGNIRDVSTVAHELGHGVHQYLAAGQGYFNSDTPLVLAETASVFAELLVFKNQLALIDGEQEQGAFIAQKLESIFATVFRQIAMNRFEDLSHKSRRDMGEISSEQLSRFWLKTQKEMFADSVTLSDDYAIWWSYIPHFLSTPGYVYSYAFGELLVLSLYQIYLKEGDAFVKKYLELLAAGGSQSPDILLKPFEIDLNDPAFWGNGLELIDEMLSTLESFVKHTPQ